MSKKYPFTLFIGLFLLFYTTSIFAASPSPSIKPSPSPISDQVVTENLKQRLKDTVVDAATSPISTYTSFVGVIRDVIKNTLVIEDKDGKKNIVIKDTAAIVRTPGNATIKADSIRIDDYTIVIGNIREEDELEAVRIIVSASPLASNAKTTGAGRITKITKNTITLSPLNNGEAKELILNTKTKLKTSLGESLESTALLVGDSIVYIAEESKSDLLVNTLMRIGFATPESSESPVPNDN